MDYGCKQNKDVLPPHGSNKKNLRFRLIVGLW